MAKRFVVTVVHEVHANFFVWAEDEADALEQVEGLGIPSADHTESEVIETLVTEVLA